MAVRAETTLAGALWARRQDETNALRAAALIALAVGILTVSAKVQVPFWPVPMTLQPLAVLAIGAAYGMRLGTGAVVAYLAVGSAGLPVFASGGGAAYLLGPTGGFLLGFVLAVAIVGWLAERGADRSVVLMFGAMLLGTAAIYLLGLAWLGQFLGYGSALVAKGFAPFVAGDLVKAALAAVAFPAIWRLLGAHPGRTGGAP